MSERSTKSVCYLCLRPGDDDVELRPYGPGGAWICFDCMISDPEREQAAKNQFLQQLNAAMDVSAAVILGEETGPRPAGGRKG